MTRRPSGAGPMLGPATNSSVPNSGSTGGSTSSCARRSTAPFLEVSGPSIEARALYEYVGGEATSSRAAPLIKARGSTGRGKDSSSASDGAAATCPSRSAKRRVVCLTDQRRADREESTLAEWIVRLSGEASAGAGEHHAEQTSAPSITLNKVPGLFQVCEKVRFHRILQVLHGVLEEGGT